jgi:hypothetical protein
MKLLKKNWWIILLVIFAFSVFPIITARHTPFEGKWREEFTNITWNFGSTGFHTTNDQGLITRSGNYSYTDKLLTCISHPAGSPKLNSSISYTYRLEANKLYFDEPVHLEFTKIQ